MISSSDSRADKSGDADQLDLFLGELFAPASKDDIGSMEHPLFSLKKTRDLQVRRYEHNGFYVEVRPGSKGAATIWDKDVLIYVSTLMRQTLDRGDQIPERFEVSAADLLRAIQRGDSGRDYSALYEALDRLLGTEISTNLPTGLETPDEENVVWKFHLLEDAVVLRDKRTKRLTRLLFKPSGWLRQQVEAQHLLTIDPRYFALTGGIERRLYELARKHCGQQAHWTISLPTLHKKMGSSRDLRRFRHDLKELMQSDGVGYFTAVNYRCILDEKDLLHVFSDTTGGRKALAAYFAGGVRDSLGSGVRDSTEGSP